MGVRNDIERVQRDALVTILGNKYLSYRRALKTLKIESLNSRRKSICLNFPNNCLKSGKFKNWFQPVKSLKGTRRKLRFKPARARTERLRRSPLKLHDQPPKWKSSNTFTLILEGERLLWLIVSTKSLLRCNHLWLQFFLLHITWIIKLLLSLFKGNPRSWVRSRDRGSVYMYLPILNIV